MSVETVGAQIAILQRDIEGIKRAYAPPQLPSNLSANDLPAILNFPGEAEYRKPGFGLWQTRRSWEMQLLVSPLEGGLSHAQLIERVEPFFARVPNQFWAYETLGNLCGVVGASIVSDTGWAVIPWGGIMYSGIAFILSVTAVNE